MIFQKMPKVKKEPSVITFFHFKAASNAFVPLIEIEKRFASGIFVSIENVKLSIWNFFQRIQVSLAFWLSSVALGILRNKKTHRWISRYSATFLQFLL